MSLGIFLSVLWVVGVFGFYIMQWDYHGGRIFFYLIIAHLWATIPLLLCWGIWWKVRVFKQNKGGN